jgi:hypothetical protein
VTLPTALSYQRLASAIVRVLKFPTVLTAHVRLRFSLTMFTFTTGLQTMRLV